MRSFASFRGLVAACGFMTLSTACGSSSGDTNSSQDTVACVLKMSGAQTATGTCTSPVVAAYDAGLGELTLGLTGTVGGLTLTGAEGVASSGGISNRAYGSTTGALGSFVLVSSSGGSVWTATMDSTISAGSFSMTVTSNATYASGSSVTGYYIHGTLTATLPPEAGTAATGTITLTATF